MSVSLLATASRILHRLLAHKGLNADELYIQCGLDPEKLHDPRARYPMDRVRALLHLADGMIAEPCWALAAGEVWRPTDLHALGYAFLASRTLGAALLRLERYTQIVVTDAIVRVATGPTDITIVYAEPDGDHSPPLVDSRLSVLLRMCREICAGQPPLREVHLSHGWQPCGYEEFFGCPVRYDTDNDKMVFALDDSLHPLPARNRELALANDRILQEVFRSLGAASFLGRVRKAIIDLLCSGKPTAPQVAAALAMAPRTLQRKLQEEGTTFQDVLDDVRKELALQYVQSGAHDLSEVAYLIGFQSTSAFTRAYKEWTGRTPSADRGRA